MTEISPSAAVTAIVADIGGTNARFALVRGSRPDPETVVRYRNDDFADLAAVVDRFLGDVGSPDVPAMAVAVAGPVAGGRARLTNHDWEIDAAALSRRIGGAPVRLLNDLAALGHALGGLEADDLEVLSAPPDPPSGNGQSLVVGIGTGFNVSPVVSAGGGVICLDAEFGHSALPVSVAALLAELVGERANEFPTVEHCFSGRGLVAVHAAASGETVAGDTLLARHAAGDAAAARTLGAYARMLGILTRELILGFMPLDGVYFAGGVARGVLETGLREDFAATLAQPHPLRADLARVRACLIRNDFAALIGCARALGLGRQG